MKNAQACGLVSFAADIAQRFLTDIELVRHDVEILLCL